MIAPSIATQWPSVAQKPGWLVRLSDSLRDEAAREISTALDGVTCKQISRARVPGVGVTFIARIKNGDAANPAYRLASIFVMGRILGVPKSRFQRLIDWLQERLDEAYGEGEKPDLEEVLEKDSELDPRDDHLRYMASKGCAESRRRLKEEKRQQLAHLPSVIAAL